jgi:dihydroflavonol-4-reductase
LVNAGYNWVDVRDVVTGALAAEARGRTGHRYLLSGHWVPFAHLAALVAEASGTPSPRFVSPVWLARIGAPFVEVWSRFRGVRPLFSSEALRVLGSHRRLSNDKAREELGFSPRPLAETIADTVDWFRQMGWLSGRAT